MKKVKKIVLLLVVVLTVVGLNVFYNDEKSYEYKNNDFLAQEVTSTECDNVLPTDKSCIKKGTKTTDEWVKVGDSQEVDSCTAGETASEKTECSEKYYYKTDYTRSLVDGTKTCNWVSSNSNSCSGSSTKPSNPSEGDSYIVCSGEYYKMRTDTNVCEDKVAKTENELTKGACEYRTSAFASDYDKTECIKTNSTYNTTDTTPDCSSLGSGNWTYNSTIKMCVGAGGAQATPASKGDTFWDKDKGRYVGYYYTAKFYKHTCEWREGKTREVENCDGAGGWGNVREVCVGGPYYRSKTKYTYTCDTSAGSYTEWSPKTPTKVNSCTATTGSTTKTECSSAKYTKTTYKKGTVEVCEQCKVTVPDTEKPVINITKQEKDGVWTISVKITDNEALASYQYGKQTTPTGEWKAVKDSPKETTFEIKNVTEAGTYYVFAKDTSNNIGKTDYTITKEEDKEEPKVEVISKNCENGSCIITIKLTDNVGIVGYYFSKNEEVANEWISIGGVSKEQIVEIKNVKETQETGTYYVFAKDEAGNIGKAEYTITSQDLDKETLLDLSLSLTQEDMIIKNKIKITNNSTLSFNACNVVVEVPIDSNVTLIEDSISTSSLDTSVVEIKVEKNKIIFTINKILEVNENIEITFNTKLKNSNVKKVVLEPSVTYYETKEKTCNKDTESDKVISLKKDINIEIVNNVPNTGKSTVLFVVLGVSVVAIGTGLVYNILKKSKHLVK